MAASLLRRAGNIQLPLGGKLNIFDDGYRVILLGDGHTSIAKLVLVALLPGMAIAAAGLIIGIAVGDAIHMANRAVRQRIARIGLLGQHTATGRAQGNKLLRA